MNNPVFIIGMLRSGTTYLDKILHNHPQINISSQPLFSLFIHVMNKFKTLNKIDSFYPISFESIDSKDINNFLENLILDSNDVDAIKKIQSKIAYNISENDFHNLLSNCKYPIKFSNLMEIFITELQSKNTQIGFKEVICEDFISYFLLKDYKVLHVVRNPLSVMNSLHFGDFEKWTGMEKPLLYNILMWKKSVKCISNNSISHNYYHLAFEDIINQDLTYHDLLKFLNVSSQNIQKKLYDQKNNEWKNNSSFNKPNNSNLNLSSEQILFIEKMCFEEMEFLGYQFRSSIKELLDFNIEKFQFSEKKTNDIQKSLTSLNQNAIIQNELFNKKNKNRFQ